jgi:predicted AlkP superfamily pyrophosphatase or phosphodiesterase
MPRKLLIIAAAGFDEDASAPGLTVRPITGVLPAVTCTAQASFRTASQPAAHGMIANGFLQRDLRKVLFWEQSAALVAGKRIWAGLRRRGGRVGLMFWQQSMGEDVDLLITPAPLHKHHGGMVQDCYAQPAGLYEKLCLSVGRPFNLKHYWGPMASYRAGDWIALVTAAVMDDPQLAPELLLTYIPTLDYDLQRHGPNSPQAARARKKLTSQLAGLLAAAERCGYETLIFGDYAIEPVDRAIFPNRALQQAGLLAVRDVHSRWYADLHSSRAFAMVDHQIAHVYIRQASDVEPARKLLAELPGVAEVLDTQAQSAAGLQHARSGELVALAAPDAWFAYPWWTHRRNEPDYAGHVDIHNKPGYDPCELFFSRLPMRVSRSEERRVGKEGRSRWSPYH